jgi:hypothetical protein
VMLLSVSHCTALQATFILLILGEAIIQLVQHNAGETVGDYVRGLLGFAVVFNIGDLYYQQQLHATALMWDTQARSYISISLHLFLSMSILFLAAGIKLVYENSSGEDDDAHGGEDNGDREVAFLLCLSAAASIIFIFIIRIQHKGFCFRGASKYRHLSYLYSRGVVAILCALIPFFTYNPTWCIINLFVLTSSLLIQVIIHYTVTCRYVKYLCKSIYMYPSIHGYHKLGLILFFGAL